MKAKCIALYNEITEERQGKSAWLTIGKEYVVLSIQCSSNSVGKKNYYFIMDDTGTWGSLQNAKQFEVVSHNIPRSWKVYSKAELDFLEFTPTSWSKEGFWEHYYDAEPEALAIFTKEVEAMYEEEGLKFVE